MTLITDEVINKTTNDYNLFLLLKKNMINGEIKLPNLSSKNRSILHKVCYNYGLEHFSTGNYKNRIIIIKDPQHTYFSIPSMHTNDDSNIGLVQDKGMGFQQLIEENRKKKEELDEIKDVYDEKNDEEDEVEEDEVEEDEVEEDEEEEEGEEEDEEVDTDTYSSNESECSESSNLSSYQVLQYANISNQLNTLRMFSYINLVMNVIIICNL